MPSPVRHASLESVWPWLPSVLLDCLCLCSRAVLRAALIVTDGRQIRCQSPKRAEQLAARGLKTHFKSDALDVTPTWPARNCAQSTYSCLHFAARNNNPALVDLLLAHGAPVNQQTSRGVTPLFTACEQGHTEVARKLLDAGADPHMARDDGASVFNTGSACDIEEFAGPGKNHT